ncbi:unnamed protein product [Somion occarium]|uniref:DUF1793-domain-containing protein n=1 Tax=Somion occarium TaxID=3059160 RepID=A0ABP1E3I5_9APHY
MATQFPTTPLTDLTDTPLQGAIRVDGTVYQWFGPHINSLPGNLSVQLCNFLNISISPTRTVHMIQAGPMDLTLTILSPIEPQDPIKQSIPLSYVALEAISNDGKSHSVQVYLGVSGEWISRAEGDGFSWFTVTMESSLYHQYFKFNQTDSGQQNGTSQLVIGSSTQGPGNVTACTGNITNCEVEFIENGGFGSSDISAAAQTQTGFVAQVGTVYAIASELSNILQISQPVVWCLGVIRNPTITYITPGGQLQLRSPYFASQYSTISQVVDAFLSDYPNAVSRADGLDAKISADAGSVSESQALVNVLSFAASLAMSAIELTITNGTDGSWNTSDVKMFMMDVGQSKRVNPVDRLYSSFPFFLYMNATYAGWLLAPLLEYQASELYPLSYAALDIGLNYPNATGNNDQHNEGVKMTGDMLIMALAHAQVSGDGSLLAQHYELLKSWSDYLVMFSLAPPQDQGSVSSAQILNSTDVTLKGVLGVKTMSLISQALGKDDDAKRYLDSAESMAESWRVSLDLDASSSQWEQLYDLFADRLLQTHMVDDSVYNYQRQLVNRLSPNFPFGIPMNSASNLTDDTCIMFTASVLSDSATRDILISNIYAHVNGSLDCFPLLYNTQNDNALGVSSPAQGAMFAPLALRLSQRSIVAPIFPAETSTTSSHHRNIVGPLVGGVIGGLALLALISGTILLWIRKRNKEHWEPPMFVPDVSTNPPEISSTADAGGVTIQSKGAPAPDLETLRVFPLEGASLSNQPGPPGHTVLSPSSPPDPVPSPNVSRLRTEMESLRRVVQALRANGADVPPEYTE